MLVGQANEGFEDLDMHVSPSKGLTSADQDDSLWESGEPTYQNERVIVSSIYSHPCRLCHESFGSSSSLWRHKRLRHSEKKLPQCRFCDKKFTDLHNLKTHEISHTNERQYVCVSCNKAYKYKQDLKNHRCKNMEQPV